MTFPDSLCSQPSERTGKGGLPLRPSLWLIALLFLTGVGCAHSGGTASSRRPLVLKTAPGGSTVSSAPYTRRVETTNGLVTLEVALRQFAPQSSRGGFFPEIWLVGVTHLGTSNYYARLQRFLDAQELVLFEGIGATNGQFHVSQGAGFSLQPALAKALGLHFQLTSLDYQRPHWVNSDLGLADLQRHLPADGPSTSMDQLMAAFQGEGAVGMVARLGVALLAASPRLQAISRLMLIETLGGFNGELPEGAELGIDTKELMRVLIRERNAVVVRDLRRALRGRPLPKTIAIFYGAGHMPDLESRLRLELGLTPVSDQWLRAFSVNPGRTGLSADEITMIRESVSQELKKK